jgi:hypothetical protein
MDRLMGTTVEMSLGAVNRRVLDVIPLKSITLNLLSVGTVYGLMDAVFQNGCRVSFLPFQQTLIIDTWIPLFLVYGPICAIHGLPRIPSERHLENASAPAGGSE